MHENVFRAPHSSSEKMLRTSVTPHLSKVYCLCAGGRIGLIDYGQSKQLPEEARLGFARLVRPALQHFTAPHWHARFSGGRYAAVTKLARLISSCLRLPRSEEQSGADPRSTCHHAVRRHMRALSSCVRTIKRRAGDSNGPRVGDGHKCGAVGAGSGNAARRRRPALDDGIRHVRHPRQVHIRVADSQLMHNSPAPCSRERRAMVDVRCK